MSITINDPASLSVEADADCCCINFSTEPADADITNLQLKSLNVSPLPEYKIQMQPDNTKQLFLFDVKMNHHGSYVFRLGGQCVSEEFKLKVSEPLDGEE